MRKHSPKTECVLFANVESLERSDTNLPHLHLIFHFALRINMTDSLLLSFALHTFIRREKCSLFASSCCAYAFALRKWKLLLLIFTSRIIVTQGREERDRVNELHNRDEMCMSVLACVGECVCMCIFSTFLMLHQTLIYSLFLCLTLTFSHFLHEKTEIIIFLCCTNTIFQLKRLVWSGHRFPSAAIPFCFSFSIREFYSNFIMSR